MLNKIGGQNAIQKTFLRFIIDEPSSKRVRKFEFENAKNLELLN